MLGGGHVHDARRLRVEDDDLEQVVGRERVGGGLRGLLGHLERQPGHRPGAVDDERHRDLRLVLALLGVHADRQDALDGRVVPAAEAVAVLAAGEEEAAAEVAHVLLDGLLLRERHALGGHVGEDDEVVALGLAQARRQRVARVDVELLRRERRGEVARARRVSVDVEDDGLAEDGGDGGGAVVLLEAVLGRRR